MLAFIFISCNLDFEKDNTVYDIIIIAGQSNTHGGTRLDIFKDKPEKNIFQLGRFSLYNYTIIKAQEPLHHHTASHHRIGFGLTFAKLYKKLEQPNKSPILIIPCGFGGTSLKNGWVINGDLYQDMIDRYLFIVDKYPNSKLKALLWHQGEADIGNSNYSTLLDNFIKQTRIDLKEDIPFIVGGMLPSWVKQNKERLIIQNIIKETPNRVHNTGYANPESPFIITKKRDLNDKIHYDAKGQRELGRRYFQAYLKTLKN